MKSDKELIEEICNEYGKKDREFVKEIVTKAFKKKNGEFTKIHRPVYEVDDYKHYHRSLIQLRPDIAMLIHLFKRDDDDTWESIWLDDNDKYAEEDYDCVKESAHQLILQLEGHWCDAFIKALRDECNQILEDSNKRLQKLSKNDTD